MSAELMIERLATKHAPHAGLALEGMRYVLRHCYEAHKNKPGGPTVEIGSFRGQTAVALLELLWEIYNPDPTPFLFTVDPYGERPYHSGDVFGALRYGDDIYADHKQRLAPFPNHAHFLMTGRAFLRRIAGASTVGVPDEPIDAAAYWVHGHCRPISRFNFLFLDGQHDATEVGVELSLTKQVMAPGGLVVVDNVDKDPALVPLLLEKWNAELTPEPEMKGARQALIRF
jgi:hypothetical protein